MAYNEKPAERTRRQLSARTDDVERKMFYWVPSSINLR